MVREARKAQFLMLIGQPDLDHVHRLPGLGSPGAAGGGHLGLPDPEGQKVNPRRLIPYLVVFLILAGILCGPAVATGAKGAGEQQAKQVFNCKDAEITAITLKRGKEEIQLTRQGAVLGDHQAREGEGRSGDGGEPGEGPGRTQERTGPGARQRSKTFGLDEAGGVDLFYRQRGSNTAWFRGTGPGRPGLLCPEGRGPQRLGDPRHRGQGIPEPAS